jgi:hypothetical protein
VDERDVAPFEPVRNARAETRRRREAPWLLCVSASPRETDLFQRVGVGEVGVGVGDVGVGLGEVGGDVVVGVGCVVGAVPVVSQVATYSVPVAGSYSNSVYSMPPVEQQPYPAWMLSLEQVLVLSVRRTSDGRAAGSPGPLTSFEQAAASRHAAANGSSARPGAGRANIGSSG